MKRILSQIKGILCVMATAMVIAGTGVNQVKAEEMLTTSRISVHDPSIVKAEEDYYVYGSHLAFAKSSDLAKWSNVTNNISTDYATIFSKSGEWAEKGSDTYDISGNLWAPDVIYNETMGKWCMYMSVNGSNYYSSIALATADDISGPYTYKGTVVYSGFTTSSEAKSTDLKKVIGTNTVPSRYLLSDGGWNYQYGTNAIDPCVLYDANGDLWMSYGSWFGGIYMLKLDKSTGLRDYTYTYSTSTNSSDEYMGKKISGGYGCTGEGSYIVYDKEAGYYYLYMSYCGLDATDSFSNYHMRLFRSTDITGPYVDAKGNSAICTSASADQTTKGIKLMGNYYLSSLSDNGEVSSAGYKSGGHNSAFIDDDGQRYLIYHTRFNKGTEEHQLRVHQQFLNEDNWPVTAVYEYRGSEISQEGYSVSDVLGTYDFVNHGLDATTQYTGMLDTKTVTLNSDNTITGDYTGTWSKTNGTPYVQMIIDNVTYKGVFFKQYDESADHGQTMTFSLIGENDMSIWGSMTSHYTKTYKAATINEGWYYFKNVNSQKYLQVENNQASAGANVEQGTGTGVAGQKWYVKPVSDGYYTIKNGLGDYSLDVYAWGTNDGTNIGLWDTNGLDCQQFKFYKEKDGQYAVLTKLTADQSALDVYGISTEDGANICQWFYWGGNGQLWILEECTAPATVVMGDADGDNDVDKDDVTHILNYVTGKITAVNNPDGSDVNGDNKISVKDANKIKKYLLGKISSL